MRAVAVAGLVSASILAIGIAQVIVEVRDYIGSPFHPSSAAGMVVFTVNGALVQYPPWEPGTSVLVLGAGLIFLIAAALAAAVTWKPTRLRVY